MVCCCRVQTFHYLFQNNQSNFWLKNLTNEISIFLIIWYEYIYWSEESTFKNSHELVIRWNLNKLHTLIITMKNKSKLGQFLSCQNHLFLGFLLLNQLNRTALKLRSFSIFIFFEVIFHFSFFLRLSSIYSEVVFLVGSK